MPARDGSREAQFRAVLIAWIDAVKQIDDTNWKVITGKALEQLLATPLPAGRTAADYAGPVKAALEEAQRARLKARLEHRSTEPYERMGRALRAFNRCYGVALPDASEATKIAWVQEDQKALLDNIREGLLSNEGSAPLAALQSFWPDLQAVLPTHCQALVEQAIGSRAKLRKGLYESTYSITAAKITEAAPQAEADRRAKREALRLLGIQLTAVQQRQVDKRYLLATRRAAGPATSRARMAEREAEAWEEFASDEVKRLVAQASRKSERTPTLRLPMENPRLVTAYHAYDPDQPMSPHTGLDFVPASGSQSGAGSRPSSRQVLAVADGHVLFAGRTGTGYGNMVILSHSGGYFTLYAHLNPVRVRCGEDVTAGTPVGTMGNSGHAAVAHLHFEVRQGTWQAGIANAWAYLEVANPWLLLPADGFGINFRRLMDERDFTDTSITLRQVRNVLRRSPTFAPYAASYQFPAWRTETENTGRTIDVADLLYNAAYLNQISPLLLLARLEAEQALLTAAHDPNAHGVVAGLGYTHQKGGRDLASVGLAHQIERAARQFRADFDATPAAIEKGPALITDLQKGRSANLILGGHCTVIASAIGVENRATWALYRSTPHMIDLSLIKMAPLPLDERCPTTWEEPEPAEIGGGNLRFVRAWQMVKEWAAS